MEDLKKTGNAVSPSAGAKKPRIFYGYIIVLASFLVLMTVYGSQYSFGVFFKPVLNEFGWTRAMTSGAYSLNVALQGVFTIICGRLCDRFGPRPVLTFSGILLGLGYLLMSLTSAIWQIYLFYGVLVSIGAAASYVPLLATVAKWFARGRGIASGIAVSGIGVGTTVLPLVANHLISSYSWRTSYLVVGSIALVIILIAAQFVKRDPRQMGLSAYGDDSPKMGCPNLEIQGLSVREAVRTRQFWILFAFFFTSNVCVQTAMVHIVPHATDIGIPADAATAILSVVGVISIGSKIGMGGVIDRLGNKPVVVMMLIMMTAVFLWLQVASQIWMLYLFAVVFAIAYGAFSSTQSPIVAELFGLKAQGTLLGLVMVGNFIGGALGPLIAGRLFDMTGSYSPAFWLFAALSAGSLIASISLKPVRKEKVW